MWRASERLNRRCTPIRRFGSVILCINYQVANSGYGTDFSFLITADDIIVHKIRPPTGKKA